MDGIKLVWNPFTADARALAAEQTGNHREALRWYATFAENSPYDLVYLAPSLYRQAQIYDKRGLKTLAIERYRRFVELWKDCDPQLQPLTSDAKASISRLQ